MKGGILCSVVDVFVVDVVAIVVADVVVDAGVVAVVVNKYF